MAVSLVKKGAKYSDTVQDQNKEEVKCNHCRVVYILGYSHGEKSMSLSPLRAKAQEAVDASHAAHPDVLTLTH